jgi:hypothetical protein
MGQKLRRRRGGRLLRGIFKLDTICLDRRGPQDIDGFLESFAGESYLSLFPQNGERGVSFLKYSLPRGRENYTSLPATNYIIVRDNLNGHKLEDAKMEGKRLMIELAFFPPYFPTSTQ